jgi:hypothetical protein
MTTPPTLNSLYFAKALPGENTAAPDESAETVAVRALRDECQDKFARAKGSVTWPHQYSEMADHSLGKCLLVIALVGAWVYVAFHILRAETSLLPILFHVFSTGAVLVLVGYWLRRTHAWEYYDQVANTLDVPHVSPNVKTRVAMALEDPVNLGKIEYVANLRPSGTPFQWGKVNDKSVALAAMRLQAADPKFPEMDPKTRVRVLVANLLYHANMPPTQ